MHQAIVCNVRTYATVLSFLRRYFDREISWTWV